MVSTSFDVLVQLIRAWLKGGRLVREALATAIALTLVAVIVVALGEADVLDKSVTVPVGAGIGTVAALLGLGVYASQQAVDYSEREQKIELVERRFHENPTEPQAAWELARVKLETYLNRNLNQVRSIFWLTSVVMIVGFILIGYGVSRAFDAPEALGPAIVAACSGVLVNLIGATFLVIYRSTMAQAKEYVAILERINAVGMAVQILESLGERDNELRQSTTAQVATQLLTLYAGKPPT